MTDAAAREDGDSNGGSPPDRDGGGLGVDQREVLGLLLVLAAVAYLLAGICAAYRQAQVGEGSVTFTPYGGLQGNLDWSLFLRFAAMYANLQVVGLLVLGLVLASSRSYRRAGGSGRAVAWLAFPFGILVSLGALYTEYLVLTASSGDEQDGSFTLGFGTAWYDRLGPAATSLVVAISAMYVAWLAFRRLPMATVAPEAPLDDADDDGDGDGNDNDGDGSSPWAAPSDA